MQQPSGQSAPGHAAERRRVSARSRRAGAGNVTEMARLLLRDAREAEQREQARQRGGQPTRRVAPPGERLHRRRPAGMTARISGRTPIAARPA